MKAAIILANSGKLNKEELNGYDFIVGADAGALNAIRHGIIPDVSIGDYDSVNPSDLHIITGNSRKVITLNPIKDKTDTDEAIDLCKEADEIMVFGGIEGKRIEHFYANLIQLYNHKNLSMKDDHSIIKTYEESFKPDTSYKFVSIFSLTEKSVISISGMKYNLNHYTMKSNDPLGVSNESIKDPFVTVHEGRILVILTKDDHEKL